MNDYRLELIEELRNQNLTKEELELVNEYERKVTTPHCRVSIQLGMKIEELEWKYEL